jgi:hypothetical protein
MSFPFRLILCAYGGSALLGWASWATGGTGLGAVLVFWLGGSAGLFLLPALFASFRLGGGEAAAPAGREGALAAWAADLADEGFAPRPPGGIRRTG